MKLGGVRMMGRVAVPVLIGAAVTAWMLYDLRDEMPVLHLTPRIVAGLVMALGFAVLRDAGLVWRFRTIAHPQLSWLQAVRVQIMCAFTSAITPSAVGGSAFAIFYLNREGLPVGRATTLTLATLFLDEMFFVVICPIIFLVLPVSDLFGNTAATAAFMHGVETVFWLVYAGIVVWAGLLCWGILINPRPVARFLRRVYMLPLLRRWRRSGFETARHIVEASADIRRCSRAWWFNVLGGTVVSWTSRYFVVNALFWAFVPQADGLLVFGRQFIVWVLMMVAPTPGGSGISEWLFTEYYGDLIHGAGTALVIALIWRIVSYYVYLIGGSALLPLYLRKTTRKNG